MSPYTCSLPGFEFQTIETRLRNLAADHARVDVGSMSLLHEEGAGKAGCPPHPWSACNKKHAVEPQVQADHPAFPARWCYGLYVIFPVTGLSCHRHLAGQVPAGLSASVGAPEPHDFTVRLLRHSSDDVPRPSHLAPNVRDDREPPLLWVRDKREHRFDLPDNAIPGTCDRLARRASHHLACSHPRVSQLSSVAGCGSAAFPSPQCPQLR